MSTPIKTPGGSQALTEIAEVIRRRESAVVHSVVVTLDRARAIMRVYLALGTVERIEFLKMPVAEMIAVAVTTLDRAQKRANERGKLRALLSRR